MKFFVTCEHGGNHIPKAYELFFKEHEAVLNTHRGYDLGALDMFQTLKPLSSYSKFSKTSRLLIELNRSLHHKMLFSEFTKSLSKQKKEDLINNYYLTYRNDVELAIKKIVETNETVIHISVHSFTPTLNNTERSCDVGLLYDPSNINEKPFCKSFKKEIKKLNASLNIRYNYPYLGKSDGLTTYFRKKFPEYYMGIELEINQKFSINNKVDTSIKQTLLQALKKLIK